MSRVVQLNPLERRLLKSLKVIVAKLATPEVPEAPNKPSHKKAALKS
jgi:hypothetical protein